MSANLIFFKQNIKCALFWEEDIIDPGPKWPYEAKPTYMKLFILGGRHPRSHTSGATPFDVRACENYIFQKMAKRQILILHHLSWKAYNCVTKAARRMRPTLPDSQLNSLNYRSQFYGGTKSASWCNFLSKPNVAVKQRVKCQQIWLFWNKTQNERCSEKKIYLTQVSNDLVKVNTHISSYSYWEGSIFSHIHQELQHLM